MDSVVLLSLLAVPFLMAIYVLIIIVSAGIIKNRTYAQKGPTCGFYAMNQALHLLRQEGVGLKEGESIEDHLWSIIHKQIHDGNSYIGEIFDINMLYRLLKDRVVDTSVNIESIQTGNDFNRALNSGILIIPVLIKKQSYIPHWMIIWKQKNRFLTYGPFANRVRVNTKKLYKRFKWLDSLEGTLFDWNQYVKKNHWIEHLMIWFYNKYYASMYKGQLRLLKTCNPKSEINMAGRVIVIQEK